MKNLATISSGVALLLRAASAQDYDTTICDDERYGDFNDDSLVYLPNAWNDDSPSDGFVCMSVDNSTPAFDVTWNWGENIEDVHSYPYVRFNHENLPTRLSGLRSIQLSTEWTMTAGNPSSPPRSFSSSDWDDNKEELEDDDLQVQANAAWDFFLDGDRMNTYNPVNATIEVMVWLGRVGDPYWLGRKDDKILKNITVGDVEFSLYYDTNFRDHHVFTAVTRDGNDVNSFDADFAPLFEYILENPSDIEDFPEDPWLGIVEFGSETWYSDGNVTFTAANFSMDLDADGNDGSGDSGGGSANSDDDNAGVGLGFSTWCLVASTAAMVGAAFA